MTDAEALPTEAVPEAVERIVALPDSLRKPADEERIFRFWLESRAEFSLVIPGASTHFRETDGAGDLVGGAATLTAEAGLGVSAVFSVYDAAGRLSSEVGVASATPASEFVVPVDTVGLSNTGLALFNTGTGSASVDLILRGLDGQERGRTHFDMNKGTHLARFVYGPGQWFPEVGEFRGTLTVQSTVPIASLGLKQNGASPAYTSVPTVPKSAAKLSMNFPHVANGSFATGSFRGERACRRAFDGRARRAGGVR